MTTNHVEVTDLTLRYGDALAVDNISFAVPEGHCLAILGANGAGKSSIGKSLAGIVKPAGGSIEIKGESIGGLEPYQIARKGLSYLPEGKAIFPSLTVSENLALATRRLAKDPKAATERAYTLFPKLRDRSQQIARTLSGGEQQMLAVSKALVTNPQVLVVDELSLGLAPLIIDDIYTALQQARTEDGVTIVLIEQYIDRALSFADEAMLMVHGRKVWTGPADSNADGIIRGFLNEGMEGAA